MTDDPSAPPPGLVDRCESILFAPGCHVADAKRRRSAAHADEILRTLLAPVQMKSPAVEAQDLSDLETIGRMSAGVAHDLNNFLQVVGSSLEMIARQYAGDPRSARLSGVARQALQRASALAQQLLTMRQPAPFTASVSTLDDLDQRVGDLLRRALPSSIGVTVSSAPDLWPCTTDGQQLEAAILNLAINARDAMPDGGQIAIAASNRSMPSQVAGCADGDLADFVVIAVTDTGSGMEPHVMARAFEPFFTTKPVGKGTGLGLSRVRSFAEQCGGFVSVRSALIGGTTFELHFPRASPVLSS